MKLRKSTIKDLRRMIEEELIDIDIKNEEKIKLDKELLETLIFDTNVVDVKNYKKIAWSGYWLRKLDLSEINTDNVMWHNSYFNNTNVKIDLSKAFFHNGKRVIENCLFEKVDLSGLNIGEFASYLECNFKDSNIKINTKEELYRFKNCDLTNIDLSKIVISATCLFFSGICSNVLVNTGLQIAYSSKDERAFSEELVKLIQNGNLDGCYINGVKILSNEEKEQIKEEKREELSLLEEQVKAYVLTQIDNYKKSN